MRPDKYIKNYIGGALIPAESGEYLDNINPAIGQVYSHIPHSDARDVEKAVAAAEKAFPVWSKMPPEKRFRIVNRVADIIEQNLEEFAKAESVDSGKPVSMAMSVDIPRAHSNLRFFATGIMHYSSESHHMAGQAVNFTLKATDRHRGLYFAMEPALVFIHLENSSCISHW